MSPSLPQAGAPGSSVGVKLWALHHPGHPAPQRGLGRGGVLSMSVHTHHALPQLCPGPLQRMLPCRGLGWGVTSTALHPLPCGSLAAACDHSAAVGTKGFGGCGVMLEAGAHRCLLTMVPLHICAKKRPFPGVHWECDKP